jgi:hypothetical protein
LLILSFEIFHDFPKHPARDLDVFRGDSLTGAGILVQHDTNQRFLSRPAGSGEKKLIDTFVGLIRPAFYKPSLFKLLDNTVGVVPILYQPPPPPPDDPPPPPPDLAPGGEDDDEMLDDSAPRLDASPITPWEAK